MAYRKIALATFLEAKRMREEGYAVSAIATHLGVMPRTAYRWVAGTQSPCTGRRRPRRERALALLATGRSVVSVASEVGAGVSTVFRWKREGAS